MSIQVFIMVENSGLLKNKMMEASRSICKYFRPNHHKEYKESDAFGVVRSMLSDGLPRGVYLGNDYPIAAAMTAMENCGLKIISATDASIVRASKSASPPLYIKQANRAISAMEDLAKSLLDSGKGEESDTVLLQTSILRDMLCALKR